MNEHEHGTAVCCPECGNEMGREYVVDGVILLEIGAGLCRRFDGVCKQCGNEFYWSMNYELLKQLVRRSLEGRDE